jgi:hypothetical protein
MPANPPMRPGTGNLAGPTTARRRHVERPCPSPRPQQPPGADHREPGGFLAYPKLKQQLQRRYPKPEWR